MGTPPWAVPCGQGRRRRRENLKLESRQAGVLLHPTSLPGPFDSGDLGHDAYRFVEFLQHAGFQAWQTLPLGPVHADRSPYQTLSAHAGNPLLISLHWLLDQGWLARLPAPAGPVNDAVRFKALKQARIGFEQLASAEWQRRYAGFVASVGDWLEDYALFIAIRNHRHGEFWVEWPTPLRERDLAALRQARTELADAVEQVRFEQFLFHTQWQELKQYAADHGVELIGDMPIFVAHDSADVWTRPKLFALQPDGHAESVAGVPPDYFSATGQRWGNPHYNWPAMEKERFQWWLRRMESQLGLFNWVRIDHFRGFESYWSIPAESETAINGVWALAPGEKLLRRLKRSFPVLPLIAEDLGIITPEVEALRDKFDLPGMKILQFAFDSDADNPYLPHNHLPNCVVYTGTHDNNTTLGWYQSLRSDQQQRVLTYLGHPGETMPWPLIRAALASVANLVIVPMQDLLALDGNHRMNVPGTTEDNWLWRFDWSQQPAGLDKQLAELNRIYGRCPSS
ncbi:MAG: 4-alpha-glucanotransferase [Gammaproteobacteria bacterium]|nr:4-alpha-glucanotransferase [Gammaproteobacteria bacterium]